MRQYPEVTMGTENNRGLPQNDFCLSVRKPEGTGKPPSNDDDDHYLTLKIKPY